MARLAAIGLLAGAALVSQVGAAWSQQSPEVHYARRLMNEVRFDKAYAALDATIRRGRNSPGELVAIYQLMGEAAIALGDGAAARDAFQRMLAISPSAELPAGTSPKIRVPFEEARQALGDAAIVVRLQPVDAGPRVGIDVVADPLGMVVAARITYRRADGLLRSIEGSGDARDGATKIEMVLPPETPPRLILSAIDEHGNDLRVFAVERPAGASTGAGVVLAPDRAWYEHWGVWTGAVGIGAAAGAVFSLQAARAQDELDVVIADSESYYFRDARDIEARGRRWALATNVAFGTAAVAAIVGAVVVLRADDSVRITPTAGGEGPGVSVRFGF